MKISRKSDYAIRALVTMALCRDELLTIRHLAVVNDIPKRFLEHIMLDLKDAGLVKGVPGRVGGYALALPPSEIYVGTVIRLFEKMLAPIACVSVSEYEPCSQEKVCRFRRLFLKIRNHTANMLDMCSLKMLAEFDPVEPLELQQYMVEGGGGI